MIDTSYSIRQNGQTVAKINVERGSNKLFIGADNVTVGVVRMNRREAAAMIREWRRLSRFNARMFAVERYYFGDYYATEEDQDREPSGCFEVGCSDERCVC